MKSDQEILDRYGKLIISECYDPGIEQIDKLKNLERVPYIIEEQAEFVKSLDEKQIKALKKLIHQTQSDFLFNTFKIFEEKDDEFEILYKDGDRNVNLVKISEMLKAEHLIEGGWIERFSQYKDSV